MHASVNRTLSAMALGFVALLTAAPLAAREEIPAENRNPSYSADLATCDSSAVVSKIQSRFSETESRFWSSNAAIVAVDGIRQTAFRPNGLDLIPRRYCQAVAIMSDNRRLRLRYEIIERGGITGFRDGVHYCLEGYDRNLTSPGQCARFER